MIGDGEDAFAKAFFNKDGNVYVNTFLHTLIANEHRFASGNSLVENVLDLPQIQQHFNFNKKDVIIEGLEKEIVEDRKATYISGPNYKEKEGKTILCLAAKMKDARIVIKLCELKKAGCDIDLDLTDEHGHTALFYSCALGDLESTKALLDAGAKSDRIKEKLIEFYRDNESGVAKILNSVAIDSDRDEKALSNYFVHPVKYQPVISENCKMQKKNESIIAQLFTNDQLGLLTLPEERQIESAKFALGQIYTQPQPHLPPQELLTGKSLLKSCLEGQVDCLELLSRKLGFKSAESPPGSVFSPEGRTLAPSKPSRATR